MEKQKTAVDFLYEFVLLKLTNEQQMQFEGLFHQAKQMEKEQIVESWLNGYHKCGCKQPKQGTRYYLETYGKDE